MSSAQATSQSTRQNEVIATSTLCFFVMPILTHCVHRGFGIAIGIVARSPSAAGNTRSVILSSFPRPSVGVQRRDFVAQAGLGMAKTAVDEAANGEFRRTESSFRSFISSKEGTQFPAVADRYHLYICYACPWASRCYAMIKLKGLDDVIGVTPTKPKWERTKESEDHFGWTFPSSEDEEPGAQPDPINGARTVRELYELANPNYSGKYTVPVLWDKEKKTIVNNESADIVRMFNNEFNHLAKRPDLDLYPQNLREKIDSINEWVYPSINNGVYRCGFATKQKPYEEAFKSLFEALDRCEEILDSQRYLCGDVFTEADLRLFMTLIRFDEVYFVHFKCNKKLIREFPNLFNYVKDVYQMPGMSDTVNMDHIKKHYYGSHPSINPHGVIPVGLPVDYSTPHNRDRFNK